MNKMQAPLKYLRFAQYQEFCFYFLWFYTWWLDTCKKNALLHFKVWKTSRLILQSKCESLEAPEQTEQGGGLSYRSSSSASSWRPLWRQHGSRSPPRTCTWTPGHTGPARWPRVSASRCTTWAAPPELRRRGPPRPRRRRRPSRPGASETRRERRPPPPLWTAAKRRRTRLQYLW